MLLGRVSARARLFVTLTLDALVGRGLTETLPRCIVSTLCFGWARGVMKLAPQLSGTCVRELL